MVGDSNRIVEVDWAKSLCMFLVILGHCHIDESGGFVKQFIYSFHMLFFFFLSGVLCTRSLSLISIKRDFRYLIIPYFIYGIIIITFGFLRSKSFDVEILLCQMRILLLGNNASIGPIWFLPALFVCKQIFLVIQMSKQFSSKLYYLLIILSFILVYFISSYRLFIPMYSESGLLGLPFFIMGYLSKQLCEKIKCVDYRCRMWVVFLGLIITITLCSYNGFVSIADCVIGNSIFIYYINAISAIISLYVLCSMLSVFHFNFILVTSYGSIVTLGLHGLPLSVLNYNVPILLGFTPYNYSILIALIYTVITYYICYILIVTIDHHCPFLFGLKGILNKH